MTQAQIIALIQSIAAQYGVNPALAVAVAQAESGFNQSAVSSAGAIGIFQLMPATAAALGVDPTNITQNITGGIEYLSQLLAEFGDTATALAAYNWGPGNVQAYGLAAAPASTQAYVSEVMANAGTPSPAAPALNTITAAIDELLPSVPASASIATMPASSAGISLTPAAGLSTTTLWIILGAAAFAALVIENA